MSSNLFIALAFVITISYALGRYHARLKATVFQNKGEALISDLLQSNFATLDYHLLNHITLKLQDGTTQIDHILVSRFGVFVIETKHYSGWLFANAKHATWTQILFRKKFKFQNPIFQNMRHIEAVRTILDFLPLNAVKSLVVFTGDAKFRTEIPLGVFTPQTLVDHLTKHTEKIISLNRMQFCVGRLETARLAITQQTDLDHLESLKRRHNSKN